MGEPFQQENGYKQIAPIKSNYADPNVFSVLKLDKRSMIHGIKSPSNFMKSIYITQHMFSGLMEDFAVIW